jgi:nucleoside-specific outer membrane channel protein Tsx
MNFDNLLYLYLCNIWNNNQAKNKIKDQGMKFFSKLTLKKLIALDLSFNQIGS